MKMISKRAQPQQGLPATTTTQNVNTLKTELDKLSPMLQNLPAQIDQVNKLVKNIETQVASLEQMRAQVQKAQPTGQAQPADDKARDSDFERLVKEITGKSWAAISKLFGGGNYKDDGGPNAVAGVRGEAPLPGVVKVSKEKKEKKKKVNKEEMLYEDVLHGGEGDGITEDKLNKKELEMGQEVEMEHTNNPDLAREIARDHLSEEFKDGKKKKDQKYYTKLKQIHKDECRDFVPAFWRRNLDYGMPVKAASGRYKITWDESAWLGTTTIDVEVVNLDTDQTSDERSFKGNADEVRPEAKKYVDDLRRKYPGSPVQKNA